MRIMIYSVLLLFISISSQAQEPWEWETIEAIGEPVARHEAAFIAYKEKLYLIGGRRINPTSVFDTKSLTWEQKAAPPVELHHFQPIVVGDAIYLLGAMTGKYPAERPLDRVVIYYPEKDKFEYGPEIPQARRRGGAGVVHYNDKIYMIGGIVNGHLNGYKPWLDEYDLKTGKWKVLADAPNARDHFQAIVSDNKLYAFGGRHTSAATGDVFNLTIPHGNVYDFANNTWEVVTENQEIPTKRAGTFGMAWGDEVIIAGGESFDQVVAHNEVEAYNTCDQSWRKWPAIETGRHGTGLAVVGDYVYTASGCGNRGGSPELSSIERLRLPSRKKEAMTVYQKFHKVEIDFEGPTMSESGNPNPFTDKELIVYFQNQKEKVRVRGFFAADGNAAESSAASGNIWRVRFSPYLEGEWSYNAVLDGKDVGSGRFLVTRSGKEAPDFRAIGMLKAEEGFFVSDQQAWFKIGTNSPENLLAYEDFDGTYRMKAESREGEAAAPEKVHSFAAHAKDWKAGDVSWQDGKGKAIVGGMNYLASKGLNSVYFLTLNINGDGKDVWPYNDPSEFTRFDVSKLAQWELVFSHMQKLGIALHIVLQETENELLLDEGNTGTHRTLYLKELISRFGHHPGIVWNIGEENGDNPWAGKGQTTEQRTAMINFIAEHDPYDHPILIHTLPYDPIRSDVLNDLLSNEDLDGISLQANHREEVSEIVQEWQGKSERKAGKWLITMDEIGEWHTGALTDEEDPGHPTLRRFALWGSILSGAAGVEWYFGARSSTNDLGTEEWRNRNQLWNLSNHAKTFFDDYLPYPKMKPDHGKVWPDSSYCLSLPDSLYAIYVPAAEKVSLDLSQTKDSFEVLWYDLLKGGALQTGTMATITAGGKRELGKPPYAEERDWVILVRRKD